MTIIRTNEPYTRESVSNDSQNMYIFTDDTDRNSGKGIIDDNSWYSKKYGKGKHYPTMTTALIRGLDNAYPITTQHWYNKEKKGVNGRWTDEDFEEFKQVIDDDFKEIVENAHKYKAIVFPMGGIFDTRISAITKERVPKLYDYLWAKCRTLLLL